MNLAFVIPCYNEEAVLPSTVQTLLSVARQLEADEPDTHVRLLFVDDGSVDATWTLIGQAAAEHTACAGVKLAHNVGHQHALWAGLEQAVTALQADAVISIDADMQDDVQVVAEMVGQFRAGADVVYGVRRDRQTDSFFKRSTAQAFYAFMRFMGADVVYNHADFRLMSRRSVLALMDFPERNLFLRGMVKSVGFPSARVYYSRKERLAGTSKYPLRKMLSFALDGITSFSVRPLRLIVSVGLLFIVFSLVAIGYALWSFIRHDALPGWTSLLISVWFIGGTILTSLGIIGEYVGKIYKEVKRRPRYIVEQTTPLR